MSCDHNRFGFFKQQAAALGLTGDSATAFVDQMERTFQAGRNLQPASDAEASQAAGATYVLFGMMRREGITPPVHSKSGLPRQDAQMGYLAVYREIEARWKHEMANRQVGISVAAEDRARRVNKIFDPGIGAPNYWLTTQQEYTDFLNAASFTSLLSSRVDPAVVADIHRSLVVSALVDGMPVPDEVLADYPGLQQPDVRELLPRLAEAREYYAGSGQPDKVDQVDALMTDRLPYGQGKEDAAEVAGVAEQEQEAANEGAMMGFAATTEELRALSREAAMQDPEVRFAVTALDGFLPGFYGSAEKVNALREEMKDRLMQEGSAALPDAQALIARLDLFYRWQGDATEICEWMAPMSQDSPAIEQLADRLAALDVETPPLVVAAALQEALEYIWRYDDGDEFVLGVVEQGEETLNRLTGKVLPPLQATQLGRMSKYEFKQAWRDEAKNDDGLMGTVAQAMVTLDASSEVRYDTELQEDLDTIRSAGDNVVWVTPYREDASLDGNPEFIDATDAVILDEDADGRILILRQYPEKSIRDMAQNLQRRSGNLWPTWAAPDSMAQVYRLGRREPESQGEFRLAVEKARRLLDEMAYEVENAEQKVEGYVGAASPRDFWSYDYLGETNMRSPAAREIMGYAALWDALQVAEGRLYRAGPGEPIAPGELDGWVQSAREDMGELLGQLEQAPGNERLLVRGRALMEKLSNVCETTPAWVANALGNSIGSFILDGRSSVNGGE